MFSGLSMLYIYSVLMSFMTSSLSVDLYIIDYWVTRLDIFDN